MLTPKQQAALNALTDTTLLMEIAEQDAQDIECDTLSRTLPRPAQALRRKLCRAGLIVQEHLHARARAHVLRLDVPTGLTYPTFDNSGSEYKSFLHQDFTLSPAFHRAAAQAQADGLDVPARSRRAALEETGKLLAPHALTLYPTADDYSRAVLLDDQRRLLSMARVRDDGHVDLITDDGPVPLTFEQFDSKSGSSERHCDLHTVAHARGGAFRPV